MVVGSFMMGIGTLSIAYFILYAVMVDLNNVFTFFWLLLGAVLLAAGFLVFRLYQKGQVLPKWFLATAGSVCGIGILLFAFVLGCIIYEAQAQPKPGADYLIILGARVKGDRISPLLRYRLDKALDYLSENEDTMVVVSGGKGPGENLSEAEAMQDYLIDHGIASYRILQEDASVNTDQNIRNSIQIIQENETMAQSFGSGKQKHLVLISNGFHLFRATRILQKQLRELPDSSAGDTAAQEKRSGLKDAVVEGMGARTKWYVVPNSYVREVFAVVKYKLSGQI
ncbi:MAG: YdcF family protein [Lachnospiraceae bacterium]|nr:YdcF family protein [Lachnospiraceae bacterium]